MADTQSESKKAKGGAPKGGGANSKAQLAQLIAKLDTLTAKPLSINLTPEQKKQVREIVAKGVLDESTAKAV